jgi:hypothetical protein
VIDRFPVDLVLHGHAHLGSPIGHTSRGVLVRNVAQYVTGGVVIHELGKSTTRSDVPGWNAFERYA